MLFNVLKLNNNQLYLAMFKRENLFDLNLNHNFILCSSKL